MVNKVILTENIYEIQLELYPTEDIADAKLIKKVVKNVNQYDIFRDFIYASCLKFNMKGSIKFVFVINAITRKIYIRNRFINNEDKYTEEILNMEGMIKV